VADRLIVRGAREHNLKDVSIDLPRDSLVVFTGLSGSGKSSLAFDTIFAEGSVAMSSRCPRTRASSWARWTSPTSTSSRACRPAVSIDQKSTSRNPRSTVGTITEVYDYLRLLFARAGRPHCPVCGEPISRQTPQQIVDRVLDLEEGIRFQVLAPIVRGRKGEYLELFRQLQTQGFSRARVNGETYSLSEPPKLDKQKKHTIEAVIDRLSVKKSSKRRLTDSVETALGLAGGIVLLDFVDLPADDPLREQRFSEQLACPNDHDLDTDDLEPRSFSFNSPFGACPTCHGLGTRMEVDPELIVPDPDKSIDEGALTPWAAAAVSDYFGRLLGAVADDLGFRTSTPFKKLSPTVQQALLNGHEQQVHVRYKNRYGRERSYWTTFEGVIPYVQRRHAEAESDTSRDRFEGFMREVDCPACSGPGSSRSRWASRSSRARAGPRTSRR
jgi:excinuclease ABC subunit A